MRPVGMQEYCKDCFYGEPENCPRGVFRRCTKAITDTILKEVTKKW